MASLILRLPQNSDCNLNRLIDDLSKIQIVEMYRGQVAETVLIQEVHFLLFYVR